MNLPHSLVDSALNIVRATMAQAFEPGTEQLNLQGIFSAEFDFEGGSQLVRNRSPAKFS